ncbi:MAG: hypothetical protein AB4058_11325 [Microcystaceae cyanobacterium]
MSYLTKREKCVPSISSSEKNNYWEDWFTRYNSLMQRLRTHKQDIH